MHHDVVTGPLLTADFLADAHDGPLVRLVGDHHAVALLRDAFDGLAAGESPDLAFVCGVPIAFHTGRRGGVQRTGAEVFRYGGTSDQWRDRARLLDLLAEPGEGFQYLDYDGAGEVGVVVSTYPDGSF